MQLSFKSARSTQHTINCTSLGNWHPFVPHRSGMSNMFHVSSWSVHKWSATLVLRPRPPLSWKPTQHFLLLLAVFRDALVAWSSCRDVAVAACGADCALRPSVCAHVAAWRRWRRWRRWRCWSRRSRRWWSSPRCRTNVSCSDVGKGSVERSARIGCGGIAGSGSHNLSPIV